MFLLISLRKSFYIFLVSWTFSVGAHFDESRVFVSGYSFSEKVVLNTEDWVKTHGSTLFYLSAHLQRLVGSPTCLSLARIGFIDDKGSIFTYDIPYFFSSKSRLVFKLSAKKQELSHKHLQVLLQSDQGKFINGYKAMDPDLYKVYDFKLVHTSGNFKDYLRALYSPHLHRRALRLQEVESEKMAFYFYHSEQSLILELQEEKIVEELLNLLKETKNIDFFFINIISTFDTCCRCGDALFSGQFLENLIAKVPPLQKLPILITHHGILAYKDPDVLDLPNPLRPKSKQEISFPFNGNPLKLEVIRPKVACTF